MVQKEPPSMKENWPDERRLTSARVRVALMLANQTPCDSDLHAMCKSVLVPALAHENDISADAHTPKIMRILDWIVGDYDTYNHAIKSETPPPQFSTWVGKINTQGLPRALAQIADNPNLTLNYLNDRAHKALQEREKEIGGYNPNSFFWRGTKPIHDALPADLIFVRSIDPDAVKYDAHRLDHCAANPNKPYLAEAFDKDDMENGMFSLRTKGGKPIATIRISEGYMTDCSGVQNAPVLPKYFPAVQTLMNKYRWLINNADNTIGIVRHEGHYHSIYDIPQGYESNGTLDISKATQPIQFNGISVRTLITNHLQSPHAQAIDGVQTDIMATEVKAGSHAEGASRIGRDLSTGVIFQEYFYRDHAAGNGFHREVLPAAISRCSITGEVTHSQWHRAGKEYQPTPEQRELFEQQENARRSVWYMTRQWPTAPHVDAVYRQIKRNDPAHKARQPR